MGRKKTETDVNKIDVNASNPSPETPKDVKAELNHELVIPNKTELVTKDGTKLSEFHLEYERVGKSMKELCVKANKLNEFNSSVFKEYVTNVMGLSRQSYEMMVKVGAIYLENSDIMANLSHTKTAELCPVREQLNDFVDALKDKYKLPKNADGNKVWEYFGAETQKDIRATVKAYLAGDILESDEDETATVSETESGDGGESENDLDETEYTVDTSEQETINHYIEYLENLKVGMELDEIDMDEIKGLVKILRAYDFTRRVELRKGGEKENE